VSAPPILRSETLSAAEADGALRSWGGFMLEVGERELPWRQALEAARDLFARPRSAKLGLAIEGSPHFRGWSEMHNERDWREQLHLGRELPSAGERPAFLRLEGPNLWPSEPDWRRAIGGYMQAAASLGETVLERLTEFLHLSSAPFANVARDGYLVMKLIGYHPQSTSTPTRPGVAPHVDFSWLTLTLQDSPGLEIRTPVRGWALIEPRPGTLWVHAGELLQFASRGRYRAAPHRVINASIERTRVSIPLFLNPPLDAEVPVFEGPTSLPEAFPVEDDEHVHRVIPLNAGAIPFHFGKAEWQRKGLGRWCYECVSDPAASAALDGM
jgi:isopenicillin N synthase-like dioxygenase